LASSGLTSRPSRRNPSNARSRYTVFHKMTAATKEIEAKSNDFSKKSWLVAGAGGYVGKGEHFPVFAQ